MTIGPPIADALVAPLSLPRGGFGVLALDQRESLRDMFARAGAGPVVGDDTLRRFKQAALKILTPHASGVLLDRPLAVPEKRPAGIAPGCGLILAADVLHHSPGGPGGHLESTDLDPLVTPAFIQAVGAVAVKLLVIWRAGRDHARRADLVSAFVDVARRAGVASLVEGIVRPDGDEPWASAGHRDEAIILAAGELSSFGPTIYKAEVPGYAEGDLSRVYGESARMSQVVGGPWVVLSNGVRQADFAEAVRSACGGGAHGFLAGRAIWSDVVGEPDEASALQRRSVRQLDQLVRIVEHAMDERTVSNARKEEGSWLRETTVFGTRQRPSADSGSSNT
jgi:sulfofructosephosphate aldolase